MLEMYVECQASRSDRRARWPGSGRAGWLTVVGCSPLWGESSEAGEDGPYTQGLPPSYVSLIHSLSLDCMGAASSSTGHSGMLEQSVPCPSLSMAVLLSRSSKLASRTSRRQACLPRSPNKIKSQRETKPKGPVKTQLSHRAMEEWKCWLF